MIRLALFEYMYYMLCIKTSPTQRFSLATMHVSWVKEEVADGELNDFLLRKTPLCSSLFLINLMLHRSRKTILCTLEIDGWKALIKAHSAA